MFQLVVAVGSIFVTAGLAIASIYTLGERAFDEGLAGGQQARSFRVDDVLRRPAHWTTGGDILAIR